MNLEELKDKVKDGKLEYKRSLGDYLFITSIIGVLFVGLVFLALGLFYSNPIFAVIGVCMFFIPRLVIIDGDGI
jgi:hypothetical protein